MWCFYCYNKNQLKPIWSIKWTWSIVWAINWLKGPRDKIRSVCEPMWPLKKLSIIMWRTDIFPTGDGLCKESVYLFVCVGGHFCFPGDWCVRCTGMSYRVMKAWTLWRALVWPPARLCEIRGCLFIYSMPLSYCIRPQTFVMVMLLVCCTAGSSLGLRDSLVSSVNEDIPEKPPQHIYRPFYNTQERDAPAP